MCKNFWKLIENPSKPFKLRSLKALEPRKVESILLIQNCSLKNQIRD